MSAQIISIFGSTGSVGQSSLDVILQSNALQEEPAFTVDTLVAGQDSEALAKQAIAVGARHAVVADAKRYEDLKQRLSGYDVEVAAGADAVRDAAMRPCYRHIAAIVGVAGLASTLAAIKAGNSVALANKESLICAGALLKQEASKSGAKIIPMDSEHSAIFQVLQDRGDVESLILTASGGPFLNTPTEAMAKMSVDEARAHPRWSMGLKISIDSASMMNKALEVIEAAYLFEKTADEIDVLVHPQSIVHSMVCYHDGSVLAQLGTPDMRTPIAYALSWPEKRIKTQVEKLDLAGLSRLDFESVDSERFPAISLAKQALRAGGCAPLILNVANETAVAAFISGACGFMDISYIVDSTLEQFSHRGFGHSAPLSLKEITALNREGEEVARKLLGERCLQMPGAH